MKFTGRCGALRLRAGGHHWRWQVARSTSPGQQADKPTIRVGYQTFPSGDLIVKNNKWLEEALPDYNIKWTKFDSGADVNTAFIAKELDFGALGSSPVARGLSAPLNIPYKVAFVLDVAGDNEALVARNGIRHQHDRRTERQAYRHAVRFYGALQPARGIGTEQVVPQRCSARRSTAAGDPRGMGTR